MIETNKINADVALREKIFQRDKKIALKELVADYKPILNPEQEIAEMRAAKYKFQ